ncbi:hypothetical protein ACKJPP_10770 [Neisseria polysaccharea]|uniref:hypothetical protein n=1 Tax=Neisseria polysaccharea TaxID=489 RepID=UPI0019012DF1|nr:hypothetical protein [Neisseria polysaccharea]
MEIQENPASGRVFYLWQAVSVGNLKIADWVKIKNSTSIDYTDELTARDGCYWRGHRISTL